MGHRLYQLPSGQYAFMSTENEWHTRMTKHVVVPEPVTADKALELTGMADLELVERPVTLRDRRQTIKYEGHKAIVMRNHTTGTSHPVTIVSKDRPINQYGDLVTIVDQLVDATGGNVDTMGLLGNGEEVFSTIRLPESVTVGGDEHIVYLWTRDTLTGSTIVQGKTFRVVCGNTNLAALMEAIQSGFRYAYVMRHTRGAKLDAEAIANSIALVRALPTELDAISKRLLDEQFVRDEFKALTDSLFGVPDFDDPKTTARAKSAYRKRFFVLDNLYSDPWNPTLATTWRNGAQTKWTAFQAISEYVDWRQPVKGTDKDIRRLERSMDNGVHNVKTKALAVLL